MQAEGNGRIGEQGIYFHLTQGRKAAKKCW